MSVAYSTHSRVLTITLAGELDHHRAKALLQDLDQQLDEVLPRQITVDCSGLTFMDSSGIAILLRLWRRMEELGGSVQVTGLPEQPGRVFHAAGLERLIPEV
jgi:stage II sporulation protein AA (anti-sigma F factor antagonist)